MDEQERAAWEALIRRKLREENPPNQEFHALIHEGMLKGLEKDVAQETAMYVVRYWLAGEDLSDIPSRGVQDASDWCAAGAVWGPEFQDEMLLNLIAQSDRDPDARETLHHIQIQRHLEGQPWPAALIDWEIDVKRGKRRKPARRRGNRGQPAYAKGRRNQHIHASVLLLWWLGMGKMDSYHVVGEEIGVSVRTVRKMVPKFRFVATGR